MNTKENSSLDNDLVENALAESERLIEIETKLAYQEDLLQSLNDIVVQQRQQIDVLQLKINKLSERLSIDSNDSEISGSAFNNAEDELPPHY
jgi:SlyX protein